MRQIDDELHSVGVEAVEHRIVNLALERTRSRYGSVFLWEERERALRMEFHVVNGLIVNAPSFLLRRRSDGRRNGIAVWVQENNRPYLCRDTQVDPVYTRYFTDLRSIAAVPIPYQSRSIGVLSVASTSPNSYEGKDLEELGSIAATSAKFLRRVQLCRWKLQTEGRPFLIKGLSPEWLEVERQIELVSPTRAPVLLQGESGTGKELVAHAIHFNSRRAGKPFLPVNCAAIPETLLESSLFGHHRGAFTGATTAKTGEFVRAHGATLFLDEVGELAPSLQAKLLRAVELGEILPLGSEGPPQIVDVRLISATNRDLEAAVREGRFREDLLHRMSTVTLHLPPLRRMKNQLEVLASTFLHEANRRHEKEVLRISPEAMELLRSYDFPGNLRELKNVLEHGVIMAPGTDLRPEHLPPRLRGESRPAAPASRKSLRQLREEWIAPAERQYLASLLRECRGDVRQAAGHMGISSVSLYRLLKKRGVRLRREVWVP